VAPFMRTPPLFSAEVNPSCGHSIRQAIGPVFALRAKYLGDQWSVGDWHGMKVAAVRELPAWIGAARPIPDEPPQNMKEYDPEWARAFWTGSVSQSCDHARMLSAVKVPVLYTHHFRRIDGATGSLMGAASDLQAARAQEILAAAGVECRYQSFPAMGHSMHGQDPELFVRTLTAWASTIATFR
jgi:pimeloyl-ACP methyl ester carboxylesterase